MAKLSFNDQAYLEKLFGMDTGYVLSFSNNSFQQFIYSVLEFDVYKKYEYESKAKLLRRIIVEYSDSKVGKLVMELLEYKRSHIGVEEKEKELFLKCVEVANKLLGKNIKQKNRREVHRKVTEKFDYDGMFNDLCNIANIDNSQKRGYEFEKFLYNFFQKSQLEPRGSFKITGEQIDGSFSFLNEIYLLEAKWTKNPINKNDIVIFNEKVNSKSGFTRGLFISYSGYTSEAIKTFSIGRNVNIVLMTVEELVVMLQREIDFTVFFKKKIRVLAEEGVFYRNILELT